ncbi:MAG: transcriptional repressor LexA [Alphaproteobacteria bacterium]|nr:transcriptional repressor LexA [Alphaproteobacteria bacterium]
MLTPKQFELLCFINEFQNKYGISPSFKEMKKAMGLKSKSGIHSLLLSLEDRGYIKRLAHKSRAIEILKLPTKIDQDKIKATKPKPFIPKVIIGKFARNNKPSLPEPSPPRVEPSDSMNIPLYGNVGDETPLNALMLYKDTIAIPTSMLEGTEHFAVTIKGNALKDAGILDGDTAIIRKDSLAENGDIAVAMLDNDKVMLRRIRRKKNAIALEPANKELKPIIYGEDRVTIKGKLIGVMRKY